MAIADRTIAPPKTQAPALRLRLMPVLIAAGVVIVALGLLRIVQTSRATTANFQMTSLRQEKIKLEASVSGLEADVASLSSLDRIERDAAALGLTQPVQTSYVQVDEVWPSDAQDALPQRFAPTPQDENSGDTG